VATAKLLLLQDNISTNLKDVDGKTPLSWAGAREEVVELLSIRDPQS